MQGGEFIGHAPLIDGRGITIAREAHEIVKEYEAEKTTRAAGKFHKKTSLNIKCNEKFLIKFL